MFASPRSAFIKSWYFEMFVLRGIRLCQHLSSLCRGAQAIDILLTN